MSSYTERMVERLHCYGVVACYNTAAATGATGATADMSEVRRVLYGVIGNGTGVAGITVQEGEVTVSTNPTTGEITASGVTWGNISLAEETATDGATGTVTATASVTNGQGAFIEVKAESLTKNHRYTRALIGTDSAQTYASCFCFGDVQRYAPEDHDSTIKTPIVIRDNPWG